MAARKAAEGECRKWGMRILLDFSLSIFDYSSWFSSLLIEFISLILSGHYLAMSKRCFGGSGFAVRCECSWNMWIERRRDRVTIFSNSIVGRRSLFFSHSITLTLSFSFILFVLLLLCVSTCLWSLCFLVSSLWMAHIYNNLFFFLILIFILLYFTDFESLANSTRCPDVWM